MSNMVNLEIARRRLQVQGISNTPFTSPEAVLESLGAVQAQDYLAALWAIGLRMQHATIDRIEQAIVDKTIVRTLLLRNTVHFVPAKNIRWLLILIGPRIRMIINNVARSNGIELNETLFQKSQEIIIAALQGSKQLTRSELCEVLQQKGVPAA
jgi:hypothetical protein